MCLTLLGLQAICQQGVRATRPNEADSLGLVWRSRRGHGRTLATRSSSVPRMS